MSMKFLLRSPDGRVTEITGPFRIGRDPTCEIYLDSDLVSRIHASVWVEQDHLLVRDERSRNGTQVNGVALTPGKSHYLHHGDEVRVGETTLTAESDPPYPGPRQHGGLAEPPPTAHLEAQPAAVPAAPAPAPMPAGAPTPSRPFPVLPVAVAGCLIVVLLFLCLAVGVLAVTLGPSLLGR
jgi:predicted component of type VI protein secretion system